jgi:long-chain acyl-CoA synthetase
MRTVYTMLEETAATQGDLPALHQGERVYTWNEYLLAVREIAAGLQALGVRVGDVVALDSETRAEFYLADVGIMAAGGVAAALYNSYPVAEQVRTLRVCGAAAVFAENPQSLRALRAAASPPLDIPWILLTGTAEGALSLDELRSMGREAIARDPGFAARLRSEVGPGDYAILYLTSGATGEPKMGLVTHASLVANVDLGPPALNLTPQDSTIAFLPSAHIVQRLVMELLPLRCGVPVHFAESLLKLPQELQRVRPTIFVAPPRLWERVHATIRTELRKKPQVVQKVFHAALALGRLAARRRQQGRRLPLAGRIWLKLADHLIFSRMRARFGGRVRVCGSGSAPLGTHLAEFYQAIGMPLIEGYGLTEGGVVVLNPLDRPKAGSVGKPFPGIELRLADDGELMIRSATLFAGYFRDPEATAQVLRDGWLATGDLAEIDAEGYVFITGRKKELIVSSTGRKIYPSRIESLFRLEPIVSQVLLVGDRLPYLAALLTVNTGAAEGLKGMERYRGRPAAEIVSAPPVKAEVQQALARVNRSVAQFEQIRKFRILEREFSIDAGELTATMKVRRSRALENFRDVVAELYAGRD